MTSQTILTSNVERPYAASWFDYLQSRVDRLPLPYWLFYLAVGAGLFIVETIIQWNESAYPVGTFYLFHAVYCCLIPYVFAFGHYIHHTAANALEEFQPVMEVSEEELSQLHYQLTTFPARPFLFWSAAGLVFAIGSIIAIPVSLQLQMFNVSGSVVSVAFNQILWIGFSMMGFAGIYGLFHEARLTDHIYTTYTRIKMFKLVPLYGFARLGASEAIGLLILFYTLYATAPEAFRNNLTGEATLIANIPTILFVFVAPLLGIHRLLAREKGRQLNKNAERLEATIVGLHQRIEDQDLTHIGEMSQALASLQVERKILESTSTWPWSPEIFRGIVLALILPTALWLLQRILARVVVP